MDGVEIVNKGDVELVAANQGWLGHPGSWPGKKSKDMEKLNWKSVIFG